MKPISVLVADSSPFVCRLLKNYLESVPDIQVVGAAQKGHQLIEMVEDVRPDVVTLGLEMPDMSGLAALQATQQIRFTPAIIISGANMHAAAMTLEAMNYGAVDFVFKFTPGASVDPDYLRREIINKVRVASHINPPLTEMSQMHDISTSAVDVGVGVAATSDLPPEKIIVIGASTGGPVALQQMLCQFPADFPSSILVVQHLPATFTAVLAEQLQRQLPLRVKEAAAGDQLHRAAVLITPGGMNVQINSNGQVQLCAATEPDGDVPSINLTMQSVAAVYGTEARGILLTGMGQDGVIGLTEIRRHGGVTFAQSLESCTVKGMPQRAIEAGVVNHIAPPQHIAQLLLSGV
jgi:two-component system, chemotaxis family, protein-glutamate methylesterase/glutaminase